MAFARYFMRFSYIGTHFRGAQWVNFTRSQTESVEGNLLLCLQKKNFIKDSLVLSSRTDSGVHALNAAAHFDLRPFGNYYPAGEDIQKNVNRYFNKNRCGIYVNEVFRVPTDFDARYNPISRTYLYRIAFRKKEAFENNIIVRMPIEEWNKVFYLRKSTIDVNKLRDAIKRFEGVHDFETFKKRFIGKNGWKHSVRTINNADVYPGAPMRTSYDPDRFKYLEFYDIIIKGKAFVHNQVRRMIGTAIAVAENKIDISEINTMLTVPSKHSWNNLINVAPACGLYLCDIEYNKDDFVLKDDELSKDRPEERLLEDETEENSSEDEAEERLSKE